MTGRSAHPDDTAYTMADVCRIKHISERTLYKWLRSGLPSFKDGRTRKIRKAALEAWDTRRESVLGKRPRSAKA